MLSRPRSSRGHSFGAPRPPAAERTVHADQRRRLADLRLHQRIARRERLALGIEHDQEVDGAGVVDLLIVLDAERQSLAARDALVQAQVGQATALVGIYRALGGGWSDGTTAAVAAK